MPLLIALASLGVAFGHGTTLDVVALEIAPDDPAEWWAALPGWGIAHSPDAGESWTWTCAESHDYTYGPYDVVALGGGRAAIATDRGVHIVDDACGSTSLAGLPADLYAQVLTPWGDGLLAMGSSSEELDGIWMCALEGCTPTSLTEEGTLAKSAYVDEGRAWATVVHVDSLVAELWSTEDGLNWSLASSWPDGDSNPRIFLAQGQHLLVWRGTREQGAVPELLLSDDGGATYTSVFQQGYYTDSPPGFVLIEESGDLFLGDNDGARTWRSRDGGATWEEVTDWAPSVRCGTWRGGQTLVCANHLADGFDIAWTQTGSSWTPVACLQEATQSSCSVSDCEGSLEAFQSTTAFYPLDERCETELVEPATATDPAGCAKGCAGALLLLPALGWRRRKGIREP